MSVIDCVQKSCTRTKRENSVKNCARNKSSEQRVCRSSAPTHSGTRTMLPDTSPDEHWLSAFSNFICHSICSSLRWICALKIHSATRRQKPHSNICSELCVYHSLCKFGESVFALIPDHEVRAAKLTNRWISGCWWGRDASSDEHLVGTKHGLLKKADQFAENLLESSGADVRRSRLEGRNGILTWKWTLEYLDRLWLHVQMKGCRQRRHREKFPQYLNLHFCQKNTYLKCEHKECTRKHTQDQSILVRNRQNSWLTCMRDSRSGEVTHSRMQDVSRCVGRKPRNSISGGGRNVESLQIQTHDHWTRVRSSMDS